MNGHRLGVIALYRRVMREARPFWPGLLLLVVVSVLAAPLALLTPVALKLVIDNVLGNRPLTGIAADLVPGGASATPTTILVVSTLLFVAVQALVFLRALAEWVLLTSISERFLLRFRATLFRHVQRLSLAYHDSRGTTDSTYRIQYDAQAVSSLVVAIPPLLTATFTLVAMLVVTARLDPTLALVAVLVVPSLFWVIRHYGRRMRDRWEDVKDHESRAMSVVQETLGAMRVVKAFGREDREEARFVHHSRQNVRGQIRLAWLGGAFDLAVGIVLAAGGALVLFIGAQHVRSHVLSTGDLVLVMAYITMLYQPLQTTSKQFGDLQSAVASAGRVFGVLDEAPEVVERPDARELDRAAGAISFHDVSFGYTEDRLVVRDVVFDVPPGTTVGVVGRTGAGKTTLVNLLTRFYDPTEGSIELDGADVRDYRLRDLRNQFALVLQEPVLFSTSIGENIAYARPGATAGEIRGAAEAAGAHEFIAALPDGYDTEVGERGMSLSGGERQRISLARAFLKDAPILILDEPTSSVDVRTEAQIMESMTRLMEGRTAFMIAHRTSTLQRCDLVLHVEDGRVKMGTTLPTTTPTQGVDPDAEPERFRDEIAGYARGLRSGSRARRADARRALEEVDEHVVSSWVRHGLRNGSEEQAHLAAGVADALMLHGAAGDVLERAAELPADSQDPMLRALSSFGPDLETLVEHLRTVSPARRLVCLQLLWEVSGSRFLSALERADWRLTEAEELAMLELCEHTSDPKAEAFVRSLASPASRPATARAVRDALERMRERPATPGDEDSRPLGSRR